MTRTLINLLPVFGLTLALAACNSGGGGGGLVGAAQPIPEDALPQAVAETYCQLRFECSCEDPGHVDESACVEADSTELSVEQLAAQAAGLTYDGQCAGDVLAQVEAAGCTSQPTLDCDALCFPYHGDLPLDAPCTTASDEAIWSDCAQGLWCLTGTCEDPCGAPEEEYLDVGEACRTAEGEILGICDPAPGLFCDYESSNCIALPGVGEACYSGEICGVGAICDYSGASAICVALPGAGEACIYECDEGLYCDGVDGLEGTCNALPGEGQACAANQCSEGNYCNPEDLCEADPAWVCF